MKKVILLSGLVLGLTAVAGGVWALNADLAPGSLGIDNPARLAALPSVEEAAGLAYATQRQSLMDCMGIIGAVRYRQAQAQALDGDKDLATKCLALADYIASISPANSQAWFVGAASAAALGDDEGMNRRLTVSQKTGRYEDWIGIQRATLSGDYFDRLDSESRAANDQDLIMLLRSTMGAQFVASRYVNNSADRERITALVETSPPEQQQLFVRWVRRLSQASATN